LDCHLGFEIQTKNCSLKPKKAIMASGLQSCLLLAVSFFFAKRKNLEDLEDRIVKVRHFKASK
jgi:hypothetical protein